MFLRKLKVSISMIVLGCLGSAEVVMASASCSSFLSSRSQNLPLSIVFQESVHMSVEHTLVPGGFVRLHDLRQEAEMNRSRIQFVDGLVRAIHQQNPEIQVSDKDGLFVLHIKGDKFGHLKNLGFRKISKESLDMVGIYPVQIRHQVSEALDGVQRVVFIVKDGAKDYRSLSAGEEQLKSIADFRYWISFTLGELYSELLSEENFAINQNNELLDKVYQVLGRRPGISENSEYAWMPKSDFVRNFNRAFLQVMGTLNASDLLYMRSSFWDEHPAADNFSREVFEILNQGLSSDILDKNFEAKALEIRERIYRSTHKVEGSSKSTTSFLVDTESNSVSFSRGNGQEIHSLSGEGAQVSFGNDFFTGAKHQNTPLSELKEHGSSLVIAAVDRLERHGYVDLAQLQRASASTLMRNTNLSLQELVSVARELTDYGIYLTYDRSVLYRLEPAVRTELKSPNGQNFIYNPTTNTYRPVPN